MKNVVDNVYREKIYKYAAVFFLIVLVLILHGLNEITSETYEIGDYASNSILILKAKKFALFVGNYSRVGFNHPGPAILCVLALGEVIFHDILHLVASPIEGQTVAGYIYDAIWITVAFSLLSKLLNSFQSALVILGGTIAFLICEIPHIYTSLWFPYLYILPFVVAVLSTARLASGKTDALIAMAMAFGFLCNGHASFPALLAVMTLCTLLGNMLLSWLEDNARILSKDFLGQNWLSIVASMTVFFLFFVPLLIMTIRHFPGPVGDYIHYGGGHHKNKISTAFHYISAYWGGRGLAVPCLIVLILTVVPGRFSSIVVRLFPIARSFAIALLSATIAVLLYAIFGIDSLSETYICLFYYAVPALFYGIVLLLLSKAFPAKICAPQAAIALSYAIVTILVFRCAPEQYADHDIPEIYQSVKEQAKNGGGRLVFDLDNSGFPAAWGPATGLAVYGLRHGDDLICINHSWHILFTQDLRCSESEVANNKHIIVASHVGDDYIVFANDRIKDTSTKLEKDKIEDLSVKFALVPSSYTRSEFSHTVLQDRLFFRDYFLGSGWSDISDKEEFVWSDGSLAQLNLNFPDKSFSGTLVLNLASFLPFANSTQQVTYLVNGKVVGTDVFSHANEHHNAIIPLKDVQGRTTIGLAIKDPISPRDAGFNSDQRLLAISLYSATLTQDKRQ